MPLVVPALCHEVAQAMQRWPKLSHSSLLPSGLQRFPLMTSARSGELLCFCETQAVMLPPPLEEEATAGMWGPSEVPES